jgi:hypothetical protein
VIVSLHAILQSSLQQCNNSMYVKYCIAVMLIKHVVNTGAVMSQTGIFWIFVS